LALCVHPALKRYRRKLGLLTNRGLKLSAVDAAHLSERQYPNECEWNSDADGKQ
jgi:hypothetical protein